MTNLDYFAGFTTHTETVLPNDPPAPSTNGIFGLIDKIINTVAGKIGQPKPGAIQPTPTQVQSNYAMWGILALLIVGAIVLMKAK